MTTDVVVMIDVNETTDVVVMIDVAVTIEEAEIAETEMIEIGAAQMIEETTVGPSKTHIREMTGFVGNVVIPISHSEPSVTVAVPRKVEEEHLQNSGRATTEGREIEEKNHNQELVTGSAPNAENQTLRNAMSASDVVVQSELAVQRKEGTIVNSRIHHLCIQ